MGSYRLHGTELLIRQDTSDLKGDILAEIQKQSQHVSEKDITIQNLRNELAAYTFKDRETIKEITALYPDLAPFSIGKQTVFVNADSSFNRTVLLYDADKELPKEQLNRLSSWLSVKLKSDSVLVMQSAD